MKMKAFLTSLVGVAALASAAQAATITYVLSLNDNGAGVKTTGSYAVYAYTSAGDNSGLASFTITTTGQSTTLSRSPQATFADDNGILDNKSSGFTTLRSAGSSGVATTGSFDTVSGNGVATYGVGQTAGNVRNSAPSGFSAVSTVAQGAYGVSNSFTVANADGFSTPTGGQIPVLLASGTFTGTPTISLGAGNTFTGNALTTTAATISLVSRDLVPEPTSLAVLGLGGTALLARRRKLATV